MMLERLLLVEDEIVLRESLEQHLQHQDRFEVVAVDTLVGAHAKLDTEAFDLVLTDVWLPDGLGAELLAKIQSLPAPPLVIVISAFGSPESAVASLDQGAFDYVFKPFTHAQLEAVLHKAEDHAQLLKVTRFLSSRAARENDLGLLGVSPALEQLRQSLRQLARTEECVLVQGEIGAGKSLVARVLYEQGLRAAAPCLKLDCTRVPETDLEAELFGCETPLVRSSTPRRGPGRCELANGRTLLLEEVSALPSAAQARLLRLLQTKTLERLGGARPIPVNVRLIATTSRDLPALVNRGIFQEDLRLALSTAALRVPSLRERPPDIPFLAEHFRQFFARKHGLQVREFSAEGLAALQRYPWPGNVRELQTVIERAVLQNPPGPLEPADLNLPGPAGGPVKCNLLPPPPGDLLSEMEKRHIVTILTRCRGNRTHTAQRLGISLRTLRNKLRAYQRNGSVERGAWSVERGA